MSDELEPAPESLSYAHKYTPPVVTRVSSSDGFRSPEPPLDPTWTHLEKLRWRAALIEDAHPNIQVRVGDAQCWTGKRFIHGLFSVTIRGGATSQSGGGSEYDATWKYLNGLEDGLDFGRATYRDHP